MKYLLLIFILIGLAFMAKANEQKISDIESNQFQIKDPCLGHKCGPGKECVLGSDFTAECICVRECGINKDPRRRVCSSLNTTWQSDCHLLRHRCLCKDGLSDECSNEHSSMAIDYYGDCKHIEECTEEILIDFPNRMRDWLYKIMEGINDDSSNEVKHRLGHDHTDMWIDSIIWKYCDIESEDRYVVRQDLFPLRAPLLSMEPCIADFLNKCDPNMDDKVTLDEWIQCLEADKDEMMAKCKIFRGDKKTA